MPLPAFLCGASRHRACDIIRDREDVFGIIRKEVSAHGGNVFVTIRRDHARSACIADGAVGRKYVP